MTDTPDSTAQKEAQQKARVARDMAIIKLIANASEVAGTKPCELCESSEKLGWKVDESCPYCKGTRLEKERFPAVITGIEWPDFDGMLNCPSFGRGKIGDFVAVRPVNDNDAEKTYLGIYLGDFATNVSARLMEDGTFKLGWGMGNPAMFVPELKRIVRGYGSWWGPIKDENYLREITNDDISNVWYVKALEAMAKANTAEARADAEADTQVDDHDTPSEPATDTQPDLKSAPATIEELQQRLAEAEKVIAASRCIRHWHDGSLEDGMVVSKHHVFELWEALATYDKFCGNEPI